MDENKIMGAGEFKAKCLKLLDEVSETRKPITITKHGKPVATVIPYAATGQLPVGCMKDGMKIVGDIVDSTGEEWHAESDE
ncbi:MAG: type II toxin-antitoxin system prevent-host-death family antitoxin [Cyanobacteria bacterium REEB67]|nr:type II toxin-antitoxin system prevent-host-death family antitoxin [Cyanobacteria bacterium REEB67]